MTLDAHSKLLVWISRIVIALGLFLLLFVHPLCDCVGYFLGLAAVGLVPLVCGPRLYRWLGGSFIVIALVFAAIEQSTSVYRRKQLEQMKAESAAQAP
jgi:hypothetical protein